MLVAPHTLSLITTHRCTAACDHCCFSCTPQVKDHIPIPNLYRYIEEATEIDTIRVVVFTGGECFLLGKELDNLTKYASDRGFFTRFVSNGYWAHTPEAARKRLQRLVDNGLTEANFSTGEQHAVYVKPEYVRYGAVAAAELGVTTVVSVELFKESHFDFETFIAEPEFKKHVDSGMISIKLAAWMKFKGKGPMSFTDKYLQFVEPARGPETGCSTALRVLAISPRQQLFACCGLPVEDIEELHLGSLENASIKEVLSRAPTDFVKIWVHLHGPDAVIRYAQRFDPTIEPPKHSIHICDVCRFMYKDQRVKKIIMENPPPNMDDILSVYFQSLIIPTRNMRHSDSVQFARIGESLPKLRETHRMATCCSK